MNVTVDSASSALLGLVMTYVPKVLGVLVLLFVAWVVATWLRGGLVRSLDRAKFDRTLTRFAGNASLWLIMLLAVLAALSVFGVETTSFAAVVGGSALAIGLAFQGSLSNFAAGVMLLVFRPFKSGDAVSVAGITGKCIDIELFTTTFDTADNRRFIVPNAAIFGATIENITHHDTRRVDVEVGVDYGADLDETRKVIVAAAKGVEGVRPDPEPVAVLTGLGVSSVDWQVRTWSATGDYWGVRENVTRAVKLALDEAGIGIPFPQVDVHFDGPVTDGVAKIAKK